MNLGKGVIGHHVRSGHPGGEGHSDGPVPVPGQIVEICS